MVERGETADNGTRWSPGDPRSQAQGSAGALLGNLRRLTHPIAHGPDRLDVIGVPVLVPELGAESPHVEVHRALIAAEVVSPDVVQELGSCPRPTGMAEQEGQQVEFPRLEAQDSLSAACDHPLEVHPEVKVANKTARGLPARPPEDASDTGQYLTKVIGLQDIVVGACVEAIDAGLGVTSPAHDHEGDRATGGPELPAELDAVSVRERGLQDDRVKVTLKSPASTLQIDGGLGLVPFLPEGVHEFSAFAGVLLHHQDADVGRYHFNSAPDWGPARVRCEPGLRDAR